MNVRRGWETSMLDRQNENFHQPTFIRLLHPGIISAVGDRERPRMATAKDVGFRCWRAELEAPGNLWLVPGEKPARQCLGRVLQTEWRAGFAHRLSAGQTSYPAANRCCVRRAVEEAK